jgi:hypothetical protein
MSSIHVEVEVEVEVHGVKSEGKRGSQAWAWHDVAWHGHGVREQGARHEDGWVDRLGGR